MRAAFKRMLIVLSLCLPFGGFAGAVLAADPVQQHNSNTVWFENWFGLNNATLRITAPDGQISDIFAASGTPVYQLNGREVLDGLYRYELSAATEETTKIINPIDNGRGENARDSHAKPFYLNGHFTVSRGVIITPESVVEQ